jgi:MFS family permease
MDRGVVALLATKAISDVGTAIDFICLVLFVWLRTESALATAAVGLVTYFGSLLGGRLSHRYGDRWDRTRAMVAADLARAAALLPLAVLPDRAQLWWMYPAVLVVGVGRSVFGSALGAATPVFSGDRTQLVNSIVSALAGVSRVVGLGLAAVAVGVIGFRAVFALDAATYVLSALVLLVLRLPMRDTAQVLPDPASVTGGRVARRQARKRARAAWPVLVGLGVAAPLLVRAMDAFGSSSQHVGLPILGSQLDPADPASVTGVLWMMWAAGMVGCSLGLRPLLRGPIDRSPGMVFYVGTVVMSAGFVGIFWLDSWPGRLAAAALAGVGDALSEVAYKQLMQRVPDERRVSAFGLSQVVISAGFLGGLLASGLVVTPDLVPTWVLVLHVVPTAAALYAMVGDWRRPRGRHHRGPDGDRLRQPWEESWEAQMVVRR